MVFESLMSCGRRTLIEERVRNEDFSKELERLLLYEEVSWRQKSGALWFREGDKNTVFSLVADLNKRNNTIDSLIANGSLSSNSIEIRVHIVQFYMPVFRTI